MVDLEEQSNIIKKLVFRLVKKHIAGSTSGAVLNVVRDLNYRGFHATVTLLNDHVDDQSKAKYNTNAYVHFIRQLSRLHLNSDVSVRLSQIGHGIDEDMLHKNLHSIVEVANSTKQRLWIEEETSLANEEVIPVYRKFKPFCSTLGAEIRLEQGTDIGRMVHGSDIIKLKIIRDTEKRERKAKTDRLKLYKEYIETLVGKRVSLTILEDDPNLINRIVSSSKDYKRNLIFEIPLGYSGRKIAALQRSKLNLSVYVPYGKDWIPYFINRLAEGRVRNIAVALLNGQKSSVGSNAKDHRAKAG